LLAWQKSPLAALSVVVAGLTAAAFRMVGPVYGTEVGLSVEKIAFFLAAFVAGGALAQYPAGWLADKFDRRKVLIGLSVLAMFGCGVFTLTGHMGPDVAIASAGLFGFLTFPIYSVAAAHAHDFATSRERVELSSSLLFLYALGAIASPLVATSLITAYGPQALFIMVACGHLLLVLFGLSRMRVRPTRPDRTAYVYLPRTSFLVGRLLRKSRETPKK
jgi:MFS family permease